jgi:hypothetical protein
MAAMMVLRKDGHLLSLDVLSQRGSYPPCLIPPLAEHITHIGPSTETERRM